MNLRSYRTFQALILAGLGLFLLGKVIDGQILMYINQRFVLLVLLAGLALVFLAQHVMRARPGPAPDLTGPDSHDGSEHDHERPAWALFLLALPLLLGVFVPQRPLSAWAVQTRGINTGASFTAWGDSSQALRLPPEQRTVLDWMRVFEDVEDPSVLEGQPADVTGFVYRDPRLPENQFMASRFAIACCVADAAALGVVVDWPGSNELPENQWVRVRGLMRPFERGGKTLPLVEAQQVDIIPEPVQPYLFP